MRTMTKSIAKSCPSCGALNRIVIVSTGLAPAWRIGCSQCRAIIVDPPSARQAGAEVIALPVPVPPARAPGHARRRLRLLAGLQRLPDRRAFSHAAASASTGVTFLAACGISMALLLPDGPSGPVLDGTAPPQPALGTVAEAVPDAGTPAAELAVLGAPADPSSAATAFGEASPDGAAPGELRHGAAAPWRAVAVAALGSRPAAYPDPMEGMAALQLAAIDPEQAEEGLALSVTERREVQRRLRLASHDPRGVDGIFGPATRSAIASWQEKAGLPATGYLDKRAFALLARQTESEYRTWLADARNRAAEEKKFAAIDPWPDTFGRAGDRCARSASGNIAYGQGIRCDFRGLRENVAQLFGGGVDARGIARRTPGA